MENSEPVIGGSVWYIRLISGSGPSAFLLFISLFPHPVGIWYGSPFPCDYGLHVCPSRIDKRELPGFAAQVPDACCVDVKRLYSL